MPKRNSKAWALGVTAAALAWSGAALALSGAAPTPPGGQLPATAPGGTEGIAGPRNVDEAIRSGNAYAVRPDGSRKVHRRQRSVDPSRR